MQESAVVDKAKSDGPDIWRDSLVRYLGYSNELGESFRPISPRLVLPSYLLAFGYVVGDTVDKGMKAQKLAEQNGYSEKKRNLTIADAAFDTLVWQSFASVGIPGFAINRVVAASSFVAERTLKSSPVLRKWGPTVLGLSVIPLIVHPIDEFVHSCMDSTTRKWSSDYIQQFD